MRRHLASMMLAAAVTACVGAPAEGPPNAGVWEVVAVAPSGIAPLPKTDRQALIGRHVVLSESQASDLQGRTCDEPTFRREYREAAAVLNAQAVPPRLPNRFAEVLVTCHGAPFTRFVATAGGLMTPYRDTWVLLAPARQQPEAADVTMPDMRTLPVLSSSAEPQFSGHTGVGSGGFGVHLESYRTRAAAERGWAELLRRHPELAGQPVAYVPVELPRKGPFVRVVAGSGTRAQAETLCRRIGNASGCRVTPLP